MSKDITTNVKLISGISVLLINGGVCHSIFIDINYLRVDLTQNKYLINNFTIV